MLKAIAFERRIKMSTLHNRMSANLDELCPALKRADPAKCMNTISARRWYRRNSERVRMHKLLLEIANRGQCVSVSTLHRLGVTRAQVVEAWLKFRQAHEPIGAKQLKMQSLVTGWM